MSPLTVLCNDGTTEAFPGASVAFMTLREFLEALPRCGMEDEVPEEGTPEGGTPEVAEA